MNPGWTQTKIVLDGFFDLLACGKCKKTPERPIRYVTCGHFFCDTCIYGESICYGCKTPVRPNEMQPYRTVAQLIEYCQIIRNVIAEIKPEDLRPLARAVRQFATEHRGVVPETDSESDGEVVQSTPLVKQTEENKNVEFETAGYIDPTQFTQARKKKLVEPETAGYVDPTQFTQARKKKLEEPETAGYVDPTRLTQACNENLEEPETAGYVNPTRLTQACNENLEEPETAGYIDPTRLTQACKEKLEEPETAGYIDPTQLSQTHGRKVEEPETVGYVDPTQFSPHHNQRTSKQKKDFGPETAGYVDPTQMNKSHIEENLEPDIAGYVNHAQTLRRHWKKNVQARTSGFINRISANQDRHKEKKLPPISASYVDSTRISQDNRKIDLQVETAGYVDPTQTSQCRKKTDKETESNDFIDPTPDQKGNKIDLQEETAGFVDPTPKSQRNKKNDIETENAQYINSTPEINRTRKNNSQPETAGYVEPTPTIHWYDEMDSIEEAATHNNVSIDESSKDLVLASESIRIEENSSSRICIPETLGTVENTQDHQVSPMEIDETRKKILLKKFTRNCGESNNDHDTWTVSSLRDTPMDIVETRKETRLKNLKHLKMVARPRKICTNSLDTRNNDSGGESGATELTEISPKKQPKLDEKLTLERREKISSIDGDTMSVANVGSFDDETAEFVEKTPPKHRRRREDSTVGPEKKHSSIDRDTHSVASVKEFAKETLQVEERTSQKRLSRIKDFATERQNKNSSVNDEILTNTISFDTPMENAEMREKDLTKQLRSLENLKPQDKTLVKKCKEKLVKIKSHRNIGEKSSSTVPKAMPKNLNKRNAKGETALHTACIKGQEDYVKALLEAGANPNTKDNANWTPLQEAVNLGHREICKMLLQAGASTNTPAMDNRTALHDAAANDKLEEASLLLRCNASKDVYDKFGNRPIDYAASDEMRALLANENNVEKTVDDIQHLNTTLEQSIIIPNAKVVVLPSELSEINRKLLAQLASKLKIEVVTTSRPSVTHVIVEANERNVTKLTYYVMLAILQGKWILNSQWITISTDLNDISEIDLGLFEVHGAPNPETPARARINEEKQNPRLFNNCFFYFAIGPRATWNYEKFKFSKDNLTTLVIAGQGEILNREPDPEDVKDCKLKPFHVAHKPIHPLHRCSHYIIYMPGKDEPRIKYNMPHIKTLPLGWFLECIEKFSLVDPSLMGIS